MSRYIETYNHKNEIGVLVEFSAGDDFTLRTTEFRELAKDIAVHVAAVNPAADANGQDVLSLLNQRFIKDQTKTIREHIQATEEALGTKLGVVRYCRFASFEI